MILDAETGPGAAWRHAWDSLRLFSPARWSSLPGWIMPGGPDYYPTREETIAYLANYEARYDLPVERPVWVSAIRQAGDRLLVQTDHGDWLAKAVVSATGSWRQPKLPFVPGQNEFQGTLLHSANYRQAAPFKDQRVLIVGGGNSAAQILAEVSLVAETLWVTRRPPRFLPDDVDGRVLFDRATVRYVAAQQAGKSPERLASNLLGDIVMLPPVKAARERGALQSVRPFVRFTKTAVVWPEETETPIDAVIWCTGFRPALRHLTPLGVREAGGVIRVNGTRSVKEPRLWLVGYGNWTGYASATLIGVGRSARQTTEEFIEHIA